MVLSWVEYYHAPIPGVGSIVGENHAYTCSQGGDKLQNCRQRNVLYESSCTICNPEGDIRKTEDKLQILKTQTGVYVGETYRSIFERANEHWKDACSGKEESHMVKHWQSSHPELETMPKFRIEVIQSFQDAMSRQLSEAVRIELRGEGVLNSKAEYSRCRVPRLTINKEEWKGRDEAKGKEEEPIKDNQEEVLESGGSAWDISRCSEKRRRKEGGGRKSKRRKYELLVGWGEGNDNLQDDIMEEWVKRPEVLEDASLETGGMEVDIGSTGAAPKSDRLKQLEISFSTEAQRKIADTEKGNKKEETPAKKKNVPIEEQLRLAAVGSGDIRNWLAVGKNIDMENIEWDDDPDLPSLEEIEMIEMR